MSDDDVTQRSPLSRRDLLLKTGQVAAGATLAGSFTGLRSSLAFADSLAGATVVEASLADPTTFNPLVGQDFAAYVIASLCFDGLLSVNAHGDPIPALAQSFKVKNGTHYTFNLRKNAKWSDGKPLTAADVVFTYELMASPAYKAFSSAYRGDIETNLRSARAINAHTVELVTKRPFAPFEIAFCTLGILPKHVLGPLSASDLNTASYNQGPSVTNGAFKFVSRQKGAQITLARNPHYWAGPAKLAGYVMKIVPSSVSIAQQLKTGEVDVGPITADQFDNIRSSGNVRLVTFPSLNVEVATFNLNSTSQASRIWSDKRVRQALWWGLDRRAIIGAAFFGSGGLFTNSPEPNGTWAHLAKVTPNYTYNPKRANAILDSLGWKKNSSGIREKNGVTMNFTILTVASYVTAIEAMAQQWKAIGVGVSTQQVTIGVIIDQLFHTRTFDMIFIADNLLSADPDMSAYYHSRNTIPGGLNAGGYKNPKMDAVLDAATRTLSKAKRKKLYAEFQNIFADDPPGIPMVDLVQGYGVSKRVSHMALSTYNNFTPRPFLDKVTKK